MPDYDVIQFVKIQLTLPDKLDPADEMSWQHYLYSKLGSKKGSIEIKPQQVDEVADRIVAMAKVLFGLHMVNNNNICNSYHQRYLMFASHIGMSKFHSSSTGYCLK